MVEQQLSTTLADVEGDTSIVAEWIRIVQADPFCLIPLILLSYVVVYIFGMLSTRSGIMGAVADYLSLHWWNRAASANVEAIANSVGLPVSMTSPAEATKIAGVFMAAAVAVRRVLAGRVHGQIRFW